MTDQKYRIWSDYDLDYEDWRAELDIQLDQAILVIADLGLWHGRRMGYHEIKSGNIRDCFFNSRDIDYATWYVDKLGDLRCDAIHYDGTNFLLYRAYKDVVRESQIGRLKEKLYYGTATRADITRVTRRLGDEIGKVYGWEFPQRRQAVAVER